MTRRFHLVGLVLAGALVAGAAMPAAAQGAGNVGGERPAARGAGRAGAEAGAVPMDQRAERMRERLDQAGSPQGRRMSAEQRQRVEQRLRERFAQVVRRQLSLNDEQFRRLRETNQRFEGRRRELVLQEALARQRVRNELGRGDEASDEAVSAQMQELLRLQRERLKLVEEEDAALAEFLSPSQRAKYFGLQDQLRRRVEEMRRNGAAVPPDGEE